MVDEIRGRDALDALTPGQRETIETIVNGGLKLGAAAMNETDPVKAAFLSMRAFGIPEAAIRHLEAAAQGTVDVAASTAPVSEDDDAYALTPEEEAWYRERGMLDDLSENGTVTAEAGTSPTARLAAIVKRAGVVTLSDVEPESVQWLWQGRIPLGKLTILDGDPGMGKSTMTMDIAARLTRGRGIPDGSKSELDGPASVMLLNAEDGLADTIVPRAIAAGADRDWLHVVQNIDGEIPSLPLHVSAIEEHIRGFGARLLIIDPLVAYLEKGVDAYRDKDIRGALAPLAQAADRTGCAVLAVRHPTKGTAANALYRGGGSIGIIGAARSALMVLADPSDTDWNVLAITKANLAKKASTLRYRLEDAENGSSRIVWGDAVDVTANDILAEEAARMAGKGRHPSSTLARKDAIVRYVEARGGATRQSILKDVDTGGVKPGTIDRDLEDLVTNQRLVKPREGFYEPIRGKTTGTG